MANTITLYWLPHCSTCQKAAAYLESEGIEVKKFHDLKTNPLNRESIEKLSKLVGGANELFSRRAIKYREMKLNERDISETEMLDLMADEYTFIKRPVFVCGSRAVAGFSAKAYDKFLKNNE